MRIISQLIIYIDQLNGASTSFSKADNRHYIWAYCPNSIPCLIGLGADHVIGVKVSVIDQVSPTTPIMSPFKVFNFILYNKELESMSCWWWGMANINSVPSPVVLKSKVIRASFPEVCALTFPPMNWKKIYKYAVRSWNISYFQGKSSIILQKFHFTKFDTF